MPPLHQAPQKIQIITPSTEKHWEDYYHLRWTILRQPWEMPAGSEKDNLEATSHHLAAILIPCNQIVGCVRFHQLTPEEAQIRYMAVEPTCQRQGIGTELLRHLENQAYHMGIKTLVLNARESAVSFYRYQGYHLVGPEDPFLGIKHFRMKKSRNGSQMPFRITPSPPFSPGAQA